MPFSRKRTELLQTPHNRSVIPGQEGLQQSRPQVQQSPGQAAQGSASWVINPGSEHVVPLPKPPVGEGEDDEDNDDLEGNDELSRDDWTEEELAEIEAERVF